MVVSGVCLRSRPRRSACLGLGRNKPDRLQSLQTPRHLDSFSFPLMEIRGLSDVALVAGIDTPDNALDCLEYSPLAYSRLYRLVGYGQQRSSLHSPRLEKVGMESLSFFLNQHLVQNATGVDQRTFMPFVNDAIHLKPSVWQA